MEKNSSIVLTTDEVKQIEEGKIPFRISSTWGFTLDELRVIISSGNYTATSWTASEPGTEGFTL